MEEGGFFIIHAGKVTELVLKGTQFMCASIAQWQSISLVNQRSWAQSLLEAAILKLYIPEKGKVWNNFVTPTWFKHTAFWSGDRCTTVAPWSQLLSGPTEIWTCIAGFKVQSANHYTIGPYVISLSLQAKQLLTPVSIRQPKINVSCRVRTSDLVQCMWSTHDNHYTKETLPLDPTHFYLGYCLQLTSLSSLTWKTLLIG